MKMKMNYLLKNSNFEERKKLNQKRIFIVVAILILLILIMLTGPVRRFIFSVASPIWKIENSILDSSFIGYFKSKQILIAERAETEQKLFLAGDLLASNSVLQAENDSLKDLLGRKDTKQKTVLASVLVKPPQIPYDSLLIDIGSNYGLKVGSKVMANANVYIGEISEVMPYSSKVTLYSTPGRKLSVILGGSSATVEAVGIGGGNFNIFLLREVEVKEGDVIVIPSITANVFGIVEKVNFKDKDSFQTVLFKSPVNISELNFVQVVL